MRNDDSFVIVERRRTPITAASISNLGMLIFSIGATLHLPIEKPISTSVAMLGIVFKYATLQLLKLRRRQTYGILFRFLVNGNSH